MVEKTVLVNVNEIKSKLNSKRDIYFFYCFEMAAYLPPHKTITIYFLKQLMDGTKKVKNT